MAGPGRPGVVEFVTATNAGRLPELVGLRVTRMAASPYGFLRGAAGLMAHDLAAVAVSGLTVQLCGDAHAGNFGLYGTADGRIVCDINDFDETVPGPWEWDLIRLAASLVVAGRVGGVPEKGVTRAARDAVRAYRRTVTALAAQPFLESWAAPGDATVLDRADAEALSGAFAAAMGKAATNTSAQLAARVTHRCDEQGWHFVPDPPLLTRVDDATAEATTNVAADVTAAQILDGLAAYPATLRQSRRGLIARYQPCDVAFRVVGTGSVGLRNYLVLLRGNDTEALILQVKQAPSAALAPHLGLPGARHDGQRIVEGARLVQADTDLLLGWTTIAGRPFIVRQFRNRKADIDPSTLRRRHLDDYGRLAGTLLARAHTRSIDPRLLDGYCGTDDPDDRPAGAVRPTGGGPELDEAISGLAVSYADQTERDHADLRTALRTGRLP